MLETRNAFRAKLACRQATIYIDYYAGSPVAVTYEPYFPLQQYPHPNFNNAATEIWSALWSFSYKAIGGYEKIKKAHYSRALTLKNIPNPTLEIEEEDQ